VLLDHEAPLSGAVNPHGWSTGGRVTYNRSINNPVEISSARSRDQATLEHTSLHSVFVSRLYFSGRSFLHLLQTRQPNVFLKSWSMSIDLHSLHFGFISGSSDISFDASAHSGDEIRIQGHTRFQVMLHSFPLTLFFLCYHRLVHFFVILDQEPSLGVHHLREVIIKVFAQS